MSTRAHVLLVEPDGAARLALAEQLRAHGYAVETAGDGFKALPKLDDAPPDVLVTALAMAGMDGNELIHRARLKDPRCGVVATTAAVELGAVVAAMRGGASDVLPQPIELARLLAAIEGVLERRAPRRDHARPGDEHGLRVLVGTTPAMRGVVEQILRAAESQAAVLVTGESGTGKELVASSIHERSARAAGPFVKLHCGALGEAVLESELFGREQGAAPATHPWREGRIEQAHGGTLFINEIGELSPALQLKLLRFLQDGVLERAGGTRPVRVDTRLIAATPRDLGEIVRAGTFREELHYRLNVVPIAVPPLRERADDVPLLAERFLHKFAARNGRPIEGFDDDALRLLRRYRWPGNVRELENAVEHAVVRCRGERVGADDLPAALRAEAGPPAAPRVPGSTLEEIERDAILRTLEAVGGSTSRAAEMLGISPRKIQYKLREYGPRR